MGIKELFQRAALFSSETLFTCSHECSDKDKDAIWSKYVSCRRAGYIKPFHTRRQPPKTSVFQLGAHVVKEYSGARQQVARELSILKHISSPGHPSLVSYSFIADQGSRVSVVMDWAGEALREQRTRSRRGEYNEGAARYVLHQLTSALVYLHAKGVIHRDIKPDNIGISRDQRVRLFDWGEALTLTEAHSLPERALAKVVGVAGTPLFMAPEVLHHLTGRPGPDGRLYTLRDTLTTKLDTWGLGCVLFFLLAGRDIFVADECWELEGLADVAGASGGVELPEGVVASAAVRDFLARCLARDPALRASAKELSQHPWLAGAESAGELAAARGAAAAASSRAATAGAGVSRCTALVRVVPADDDCLGVSEPALDGPSCGDSGRLSTLPCHACGVAAGLAGELRAPRVSAASSSSDEAFCEVVLRPVPSGSSLSALAL